MTKVLAMTIVPNVPGQPIYSLFSGYLEALTDRFDQLVAEHMVIIFRDVMSREEQVAYSVGPPVEIDIADAAARGTNPIIASLLTVVEGDADSDDFDRLSIEIQRALVRLRKPHG